LVVAKGRRTASTATHTRDRREHKVPIVEKPPVERALDAAVSNRSWKSPRADKAVAEIIRYVLAPQGRR